MLRHNAATASSGRLSTRTGASGFPPRQTCILARTGSVVVCEMRPSAFETVAGKMLARDGVEVIWQLHLRAATSYRRGNWLSALALVGIADTAERLWRGNGILESI